VFAFDNRYVRLPERFWRKVAPTVVKAPRVLAVNGPLADLLGIDAAWLASQAGADALSGNVVPAGADPIALAYAGHQFGGFNPQLGDGRAILLGEVVGKDGLRRDVQLKGSGRTPFSRGGDGRAALGPVLREYVVSEAMFALGIPTTRSLAAVETGETVQREEPLPGAVLTRVARSHVRVGTFQFFAARKDREALEALTTHTLELLYPDAAASVTGASESALALLDRAIAAHAYLVARWMGVGFVHGVMNTDNTSLSGETIDYGPCAFLDEYDPEKRFSSIDHQGRYAFGNQPQIALWNLARLAEALLEVIHPDENVAAEKVTEKLDTFAPRFNAAYAEVMRAKLGLTTEDEADNVMIGDLFERLAGSEVDFSIFFRRLCEVARSDVAPTADLNVAELFAHPGAWYDWAPRWRARLAAERASGKVGDEQRSAAMRAANPAFIPRNHRIEEMIAAARKGDLAPFQRMNAVLARPYDEQPENGELAKAPRREERVTATFCGT
jgi:uncharacterized protein YdiU (UPF0061 family)